MYHLFEEARCNVQERMHNEELADALEARCKSLNMHYFFRCYMTESDIQEAVRVYFPIFDRANTLGTTTDAELLAHLFMATIDRVMLFYRGLRNVAISI